MTSRHSTISFSLDAFAVVLLRAALRFQDLLHRMKCPPQYYICLVYDFGAS